MFHCRSVLRSSPRQGRLLISKAQLRQTASKAILTSAAAQDTNSQRTQLLLGGLVATAAAGAGIFAYDQQQKTTDCCGIIGVVAHPKFDVRWVEREQRRRSGSHSTTPGSRNRGNHICSSWSEGFSAVICTGHPGHRRDKFQTLPWNPIHWAPIC